MPFLTRKDREKDKEEDVEQERIAKLEQLRVIEDDRALVKHVFGNLYGINKVFVANPDLIKKVLEDAINASSMKLLETKSFDVGGRNGAIAAISIIRGGHVALYAWPTHGYANLDIYTTGPGPDPNLLFSDIVARLRPRRHQIFNVDRSQIDVR